VTLVSEAFEIQLPRSRDCSAHARRLVERHLGADASGAALDDVKLVVSELVENAYRHGEGEIRLSLRRQGDAVRVEVVDQGQGAAIEIRETPPDRWGGQGLKLIDTLSRDWGAFEGTTHVWAEVPLS
jgi:anti-sigma regulatory factor (Ser/Thr protein kinase)